MTVGSTTDSLVKLKIIMSDNIEPIEEDSQIVLYQPDESISLEVKLDGDFTTVWLSIDQMSVLFGRDKSVIGKHVRTIFKEGELQKDSVWAKFAYTASDGKTYQVDYYNLDVVISVGYRVKSPQGTKFRIWATSVLRDYLLQGYSVNRHLIALQENMDKACSASWTSTTASSPLRISTSASGRKSPTTVGSSSTTPSTTAVIPSTPMAATRYQQLPRWEPRPTWYLPKWKNNEV